MRFEDLLDVEKKKLLNDMRQALRKTPEKTQKRELPTVEEINTRERERKEIERLMGGPSYRRGRGGAIRQTRHS